MKIISNIRKYVLLPFIIVGYTNSISENISIKNVLFSSISMGFVLKTDDAIKAFLIGAQKYDDVPLPYMFKEAMHIRQ
jgi:hypothetical protein